MSYFGPEMDCKDRAIGLSVKQQTKFNQNETTKDCRQIKMK